MSKGDDLIEAAFTFASSRNHTPIEEDMADFAINYALDRNRALLAAIRTAFSKLPSDTFNIGIGEPDWRKFHKRSDVLQILTDAEKENK